jgi:hypothetical protein
MRTGIGQGRAQAVSILSFSLPMDTFLPTSKDNFLLCTVCFMCLYVFTLMWVLNFHVFYFFNFTFWSFLHSSQVCDVDKKEVGEDGGMPTQKY